MRIFSLVMAIIPLVRDLVAWARGKPAEDPAPKEPEAPKDKQ